MPRYKRLKEALGGAMRELMKKTFTDADLTAAATTQSIPIGTLPAGAIPIAATFDTTEAFVGLTAPTVNVVGATSGGPISANGATINSVLKAHASHGDIWIDGEVLDADFADTATNLDQASAGTVEIIVYGVLADDVQP